MTQLRANELKRSLRTVCSSNFQSLRPNNIRNTVVNLPYLIVESMASSGDTAPQIIEVDPQGDVVLLCGTDNGQGRAM